jgi:hypothetical protein
MALPTNWVNNIGMQVDADFLNQLGTEVNANTDAIAGLHSTSAVVSTMITVEETLNFATYGDLPTTTDTVTAVVGPGGAVMVQLELNFSTYVGGSSNILTGSFALSGANTMAASDDHSVSTGALNTNPSKLFILGGLTPGSTVFKMKYKTNSGSTIKVNNRRISVIAL